MKITKAISITDTILGDIERRAAAINLPMRDLLATASIDWSTWWRWRNKKSSPTITTLNKITMALDAAEKSGRKAA